ncbi:MAG TPA: hypothetical protein VJM49_20855, partial [Acidimicrobiales bacterium]|nr:hypothetical protein [Acidimicrobiales bacterium]
DEDVVQIRTIAEQVAEVTGAPVTFAEGAGPDTRDYQVDFTRIGKLLPAFAPQWTIARGIEQLARDMHDIGLSADDFEGPRFVRVARVRALMAAGRLDDDLRVHEHVSAGADEGGAS